MEKKALTRLVLSSKEDFNDKYIELKIYVGSHKNLILLGSYAVNKNNRNDVFWDRKAKEFKEYTGLDLNIELWKKVYQEIK